MKNHQPDLAYVNGELSNSISLADRGLQFGDGLFETILFIDGQAVLLTEHLERLCRDSGRLFINIDKEKLALELARFIENIARGNFTQPGVLKIIITRESSGRGYTFSKQAGANRLLQYYAGISYPAENHQGVRVGLSDVRLSDDIPVAGIKHLNRLQQVLVSSKIRKPLYQETLVSGARGEIIEGSFTNLFVVKNGVVATPKLDKAGVRGVMRDHILEAICPMLDLPSEGSVIGLDALINADEIFIGNSVCGIWPVIAVDVREYPVGRITLEIQRQIDALGYSKLYLRC